MPHKKSPWTGCVSEPPKAIVATVATVGKEGNRTRNTLVVPASQAIELMLAAKAFADEDCCEKHHRAALQRLVAEAIELGLTVIHAYDPDCTAPTDPPKPTHH